MLENQAQKQKARAVRASGIIAGSYPQILLMMLLPPIGFDSWLPSRKTCRYGAAHKDIARDAHRRSEERDGIWPCP